MILSEPDQYIISTQQKCDLTHFVSDLSLCTFLAFLILSVYHMYAYMHTVDTFEFSLCCSTH